MQTTQPLDPKFIVLAWPLANYYGVNSIDGARGYAGYVHRPAYAYVDVYTSQGIAEKAS